MKKSCVLQALVEMAAARASFMEQLALRHPHLKDRYGATDQAFMVGILSLMDEVYKVSVAVETQSVWAPSQV